MPNNSKYKTLAKDTGLFALSSFGSKILVFFLTPLYTHILLPEEYGIADLITTTVNFIYPILTLAIADAALRFALDTAKDKREVFDISLLFTAGSGIIIAALYPVISLISPTLKDNYLFFVAIYFFFNIHNTFSNYLKGIEKTKEFAIQGLIHTATIILSNVMLLLVFKVGLQGYLLSIIIGYIFPIIYMIFVGKLYKYVFPFQIKKETLIEMLKYSLPVVPTILAWAVNTSIDKYMIIYFIGLDSSGIYSVAHKVPTLLTTVLSVFIQAWQISAINNYGSSDESEYYSSVYKILDVLCILGCIAIIPLSKVFSKILFEEAYYSAWQYVPMLTLSAMFSSLSGFLAAAFRASKRTGSLFISVVIGAIINIILNFVLIKTIGTIGAAYATAVCFFIVWFVRVITIQKIVAVKIKIVQTILNYTLLFVAAFLFTIEFSYSYYLFAGVSAVIVALNFSTIVDLLKKTKQLIKNKLNKGNL